MAATSLQRELKKKRPFDSSAQEALLGILRLSDRFENRMGKLFRQYGLTNSQYNVLRILRGEGKPLPCLEIADRMIRVVPAITGLIDRLERAGLVTRHRCEEDRRVVRIAITTKALKVLAKLDQPVNDLHERLLGHLTATELKDLIRLLDKARSFSPEKSAAG